MGERVDGQVGQNRHRDRWIYVTGRVFGVNGGAIPDPHFAAKPIGFIGLGNMGSALASNLIKSGHTLVAYDAAGLQSASEGLTHVANVGEVARHAEVVVYSLPDGNASKQVSLEIADVSDRLTTHIVDTSTIGVHAAGVISALLDGYGVSYVDAPVSGGVAGARARTLMIMYAGARDACVHVDPVLAGLSDHRHRVGEKPGMGQALKLANNFLSATALVATSEAISFGRAVGLDMDTMLEVLNASSGQSAATSDKFPRHVLTGRYAAGFANLLMTKDLRLYRGAVDEQDSPSLVGPITMEVWERFSAAEPGADFTRIFPFVEGR